MNADPKTTTPAGSEPASTLTTLPIWLVVLMLLLLFWGAVYFDKHGGWFQSEVYTPYVSIPDLDRYQPRARGGVNLSHGKAMFVKTCELCHGPDGAGKPGQAPPLAGSEWVNAKGANRLVRIVALGLNGPIEVSGKQYSFPTGMTPFGSVLSDEDIAAVLSYIRQQWGNKAAPVTVEEVSAIRTELGNRAQAMTVEELLRMPEELK